MDNRPEMRKSRMLKKFKNGEMCNCIKVNLADSRVVEIAGMAGFDCVWADMEHVSNDWSVIERQVLASKIYDMDIIVRVSRGGYSDYVRPLELDATGIMVPHIMGLEDAKRVARMTKFHPTGRRPVDGGNADGAFTAIEMLEYMKNANSERITMVQIEDPEPLDELEQIIELDGIDLIFFGPADFSQGIGDPGNFSHPLIKDTFRRIPELTAKYGKYAGTVAGLVDLKTLRDYGYQFVSIGADVVGLWNYFKEVKNRFGGFDEHRR